MRSTLIALAVGLTTVCWANSTARAQGSSAEQPHLGPSFPCPSPNDPLAQLMCSSPDLSRADLSFVQAYQALRAQLDPNGQNKLRQEAVTFNQAVRSQCGIGAPNSGKTASPAAIPCVLQRYLSQRNIWAGRLTGPAAEEAARSLQAHVALQANLKALGFLTPDTVVDGVYGPATRTAILQWQQSRGRSLTGLLGNSDGALLEQQAVTTTAALLEQQAAALQSQPSPSSVGPTETASRLAVPSYAQLPTLAQKPAGQATPPPPAAVVQTPSAIQPPPAALQPEQQVDEQQTNIPANCSDVTVDDLNEDFRSGGSNVKAIQIIHSEPVPNSDAINKLKNRIQGYASWCLGRNVILKLNISLFALCGYSPT